MSFRTLKNKFKQPFYKEDLYDVLKNGFIACLLYGTLFGALQYFLNFAANYGTTIFIFLIGFFVAKKVATSYYNFHIFYQILAVVLFFVGYGFYSAVYSVMISRSIYSYFIGFVNGILGLVTQFFPSNLISLVINANISGILSVLILIYTIYFTYTRSRNQY